MTPKRAGVPDDEPWVDKSCEWIDGQAVEKPGGGLAGLVGCRLLCGLHEYVKARSLGWVFGSTCGYQSFADQPSKVRKADITFVAHGRFAEDRVPRGNIRFPPDLACEVIANDGATDLEQRIADFLRAGTRLFWIIYPLTHSVWVVRHDGTAARLTETQSLSGETVIPGFTCPLATLFAGI